MPRASTAAGLHRSGELQSALDATDVIGNWEWDVRSGIVSADALVALLFDVEPALAQGGVQLQEYVKAIHPEDRERIHDLLRKAATEGSFYIAEYRVFSADGVTRWVLARGHFELDISGMPLRGRGIVVDMTRNRAPDGAYASIPVAPDAHPLERAAAHCIEASMAIDELDDGVLKQLVNVLLVAIGRRVARAVHAERLTHQH